MTRRCSHCGHNGHNSRTCPNRGVKLFGVRLTDGSIRKSASMGNLAHYSGSGSGSGSPADGPPADHVAADGYASEDFIQGSRERKKGDAFVSLCLLYVSICLTSPICQKDCIFFISGMCRIESQYWLFLVKIDLFVFGVFDFCGRL